MECPTNNQHQNDDVMLQSEADSDGLTETLELLSTPGFRRDFAQAQLEAKAGDTFSFKDVFGEEQ